MKFVVGDAVTFSYYLGRLLRYAAHVGIDVMVTEVQRFTGRQAKLVEAGASETMESDHLVCRAADIDVVTGGRVIADGDHHCYHFLAAYWKTLNPGCYWGGDWETKDSRHFGYKPLEAA